MIDCQKAAETSSPYARWFNWQLQGQKALGSECLNIQRGLLAAAAGHFKIVEQDSAAGC